MSIKKRQTKSGIRYQVRYRDPLGRQVSRQFKTKRAAEDFEDEENSNIRKGEWIDPRSQTTAFDEWAQLWLESNPGKRDTSYARDEIVIRLHLTPAFGKRSLAQILPMDVQKAVNKWSTKLSSHTVHRQYRTLGAIFRSAVNCDLIVKSPCRGIKLPSLPKNKPFEMDADSLAELVFAMGRFGLMAEIGAVLGLRWGEVAGLRVCDLDLLNKRIRVEQQVSRDKQGRPIITPPKTDAGVRSLSIPQSLVEACAEHLCEQGLTASDGETLLFADIKGGPLAYNNWLRRTWYPARETAVLPELDFHDLRRANATAMVATGVDIKTAQTRLGHSDPRMILAVYAQATSQGDIDAATRLGNHFAKKAAL